MSRIKTPREWFEDKYGKANHGVAQFAIMEEYAQYVKSQYTIQRHLIDLGLEYANDYLTIEKMASDKGINPNILRTLIEVGIDIRNENKGLKGMFRGMGQAYKET